QGDYGLFQCCVPCHKKTYDNEEIVKKMLISQGFEFKDSENKKDGGLIFRKILKKWKFRPSLCRTALSAENRCR
ncbi:MAG: hypothetical protein Q4P83_08295, partial [Spirochaetales bacterium]|nr:hypothetical protein [Spirochaetales bacterium]